MHLKSFTKADWLKVGGALALVVSSFLAWLEITLQQGDVVRHGTANAYDFTFTGALPVVLGVLVGAVTVLLAIGRIPRHRRPWPLVLLLAAAAAAGLLLVRLIANPYDGRDLLERVGGSVTRSAGMAVSAVAGLVVLVGALMAFTAAGSQHPQPTRSTDDEQRLQWAPSHDETPLSAPSPWDMPSPPRG